MKKRSILISFILCILIISIFAVDIKAATDISHNKQFLEKKNILILNNKITSSFEESLSSGIILYIKERLPNSRYIVESLRNYNNENPLEKLKFLLNEKSNYDLIICLDKESTKLIEEVKGEYIKDVPVLFAYPDDYAPNTAKNFAGYYIPYNFRMFINQLLFIHPNTKEVNILINKGFTNSYFYEQIIDTVDYYNNNDTHIKFNLITSSFKEARLLQFNNKNSLNIIYTHTYKKISPGVFIEYTGYETGNYIAKITKNPTYGGFSEFITGYNIGGYNYNGFEVGRRLVNHAVDILSGEKNINDIGINEYKVDKYLQINTNLSSRYNIPKNLEGTEYIEINVDDTTLDKDRNFIITLIITILLVITITLIGLNFYVKKLYFERLKIDKMKNNFIANVSHELRTPLNIIISCIQLLEVKKKKGDIICKSQEDFDQKFLYLQKNSSRLLRLVNNIIDITKIDAGFFNIDKINSDLINVVEDITLSSVPYAESKNITLIFDTNVEELYFSFDKERIERVILNLLSNSLKFTPENGNILVVVEKKEKCVLVKVKDSGIGISNDKLDKIFDRFVQAEDSLYRKSEGSGIGLSICKALVELHSGSIMVESEIGVGSTFIIELPLITSTDKKYPNKIEDGISKQVNIEYSDFNNYF